MTDKRILIVTTTRADWGILSSLARLLTSRADTEVTVAVGNMHLLESYGHTVEEICSDCYDRLVYLDAPLTNATPIGMTDIMAATAQSTARVIAQYNPHILVILGDRYEILGSASSAVFAGLPIVHLHGGEVTLGAIDDTVRRALSAMASLHLVATQGAAERLMKMGVDPESIVLTGAIGVENVMNIEQMSLNELKASLDNFEIDPNRTLLVTYHPVTRGPKEHDADNQLDEILIALEKAQNVNAIITYPNNDSGADTITAKLNSFAAKHPDRIRLVKSLGLKRYISAMNNCLAVVGNTSSGILEAPSTCARTIDIGPRQNGRERAQSVIHIEADADEILRAIRHITHLPRRHPCPDDNPYYRPGAAMTAANAIIKFISNTINE